MLMLNYLFQSLFLYIKRAKKEKVNINKNLNSVLICINVYTQFSPTIILISSVYLKLFYGYVNSINHTHTHTYITTTYTLLSIFRLLSQSNARKNFLFRNTYYINVEIILFLAMCKLHVHTHI